MKEKVRILTVLMDILREAVKERALMISVYVMLNGAAGDYEFNGTLEGFMEKWTIKRLMLDTSPKKM